MTTDYPIGSQIECVWPGGIMRRRYTVRAQSQDGKALYCAGSDGVMRRVDLHSDGYTVERVHDAGLLDPRRILSPLADGECTCDDHHECVRCQAAAAINEAGEILDHAVYHITGKTIWEHAREAAQERQP